MSKHGVPETSGAAGAADSAGLAGAAEAATAAEGSTGAVVGEAAERVEAAGAEQEPEVARATPRSKARFILPAAVGALLVGSLAWWLWPASDVKPVTVLGVEYSTNLRVDDHGGYTYVYVPVNTEVGDAVLSVQDQGDRKKIREFLDSLDTLVPGEHVLSLSGSNLHFIIDGMAE